MKIIFLNIFIILVLNSNGQKIYPYRQDSLWGYCDSSKRIIINPKYDYVSLFSSSIAVVELNNKYGLINTKGEEITELKYSYSKLTSNNLAIVWNNKLCGLVDSTGKEVIPVIYKEIILNQSIIGLLSNVISNSKKYNYLKDEIILKNNQYFYRNGENLLLIVADEEDIENSDTLCNFQTQSPSDNSEIKMIIGKTDIYIEGFLKKQWKFFNYNGIQLSVQMFDKITRFSGGYAGFKVDEKWGIIDTAMKIVLKPKFDEISFFSDGYCAVKSNDLWGFINSKGELKIKCQYKQAHNFQGNFVWVKQNNKWGLINIENKIIIPFEYDYISYYKEGLAYVEKNNKWGFIDTLGHIIIPFVFSQAFEFSEGLALVCYNDSTCGYINKNGETAIPFVYSINFGGDFMEGMAEVRLEKNDTSRYGFINNRGDVIIPVKYNTCADYNYFKNGIGELVFPPESNIDYFENEDKRRFYFDKYGTIFAN